MKGKWRAMLAIALAGAMQLLDVSMVNIALPDIQSDLDASFNELRWVVDANALTLAATVLIYGSLGDRLGRRRVFVSGMVAFAALSLAAGLAPTAVALDILRGAQGLAAAAMLATALALIGGTYSGRDRNTALGVWGGGIALALAVGPLLGGLLVESFGWRSVFFVNVPLGVISAALVVRGVPESRDLSATGRPDFYGLIAIAASMTLVLLALFRGGQVGWGSPLIIGLFAGSAVLLALFIVIETRVAQPLLDLRLFRRPSTTGAFVGQLAIAASFFSVWTYLIFYLQNTLGYNPFQTGLILFPLGLSALLGAAIAGRLANHVPLRVLLASALTLAGIGMLLIGGLDERSDWRAVVIGGMVAELGTGATNPAIGAIALGAAARARSGMAAGLSATARYLGIAIGVAGLGTILESHVGSRLQARLGAEEAETLEGVVSTGNIEQAAASVPADAQATVAQVASSAFISGINEILIVSGLVAFAGAAVALVLVRARDMGAEATEQVDATPLPEPTTA
ncbi:MAG: MFS transporter [Solirubrobacterales bacterium]